MEITPGKKATEFYALIGAMILLIANGTEYVNIPWSTLNVFLPIAVPGYAAMRTVLKNNAVKAKAALEKTNA